MAGWLITLVIGLLLFLAGSSAKSRMAKFILWSFGFMCIVGAIPGALQDPIVAVALTVAAIAAVVIVIFRIRKAAKKKRDDNEGRNAPHIHIHNYPR